MVKYRYNSVLIPTTVYCSMPIKYAGRLSIL